MILLNQLSVNVVNKLEGCDGQWMLIPFSQRTGRNERLHAYFKCECSRTFQMKLIEMLSKYLKKITISVALVELFDFEGA